MQLCYTQDVHYKKKRPMSTPPNKPSEQNRELFRELLQLTLEDDACADRLGFSEEKTTAIGADRAKQLLEKAESGDATDQVVAGIVCGAGLGMPQDEEAAYHWFSLAEAQDNETARMGLDVLMELTDIDPSPEEFARYLEAAKKGDVEAMLTVACRYEAGDGVEVSDSEALKWWIRAADSGDLEAILTLGEYYAEGHHTPRSIEKAVLYWRKAADLGNVDGQVALAMAYFRGEGVKENPEEGARLLRLAANQHHGEACYTLFALYREGKCLPQSDELARTYLIKAAETGMCDALVTLGDAYTEGLFGVKRSPNKAVQCYREAAEQGAPVAMRKLAHCYKTGTGIRQSLEAARRWTQAAIQAENDIQAYEDD